jgi:hypothetical protein
MVDQLPGVQSSARVRAESQQNCLIEQLTSVARLFRDLDALFIAEAHKLNLFGAVKDPDYMYTSTYIPARPSLDRLDPCDRMAILEILDGKPVFPLWAVVIGSGTIRIQDLTPTKCLDHKSFILELERRVDKIAAHIASATVQNHPVWEAVSASLRNRISYLRRSLGLLEEVTNDGDDTSPDTLIESSRTSVQEL